MKAKDFLIPIVLAGAAGWFILQQTDTSIVAPQHEPVAPNWVAIAAWPEAEIAAVEAQPDPNRRVTAIVLDDSGSMGGDMEAAKQAVVDALAAMQDSDRVSVVALNSGIVMPFTSVADARGTLPNSLRPIISDGGTPLTQALGSAQTLLEEEAGSVRGFGTFRMIVTTDGVADDSEALNRAVEQLAATTPIQLTTIGIGISGNHVLRRSDLGSFVDVDNVDALEAALQAAVAENTDFTAITDFSESEG
ncbi:vWA domain-containing protein [Aestuariibius sp. 2305UL40-4]|uniref:vWA domain-containing protein n=1 Tax=Aestuariibius violaceus TaxID=3234132 RepID=UPI00345E4317